MTQKKPQKNQLSSFTGKFPVFKDVLYSALASDVMPNTWKTKVKALQENKNCIFVVIQ